MFGYININQKELSEESKKIYQAYYCGLCQKLKTNCGTKGQMLFKSVPLHSHLISVVEIFLIFCISCGNILREHSPCGINHQCDRQPVKNAKAAEHRQKKQYQCSNALCLCQFIRPISSNHKTLYFLPHCSDLLSSDFMLRFKGNRVNTPIVF